LFQLADFSANSCKKNAKSEVEKSGAADFASTIRKSVAMGVDCLPIAQAQISFPLIARWGGQQ